MALFFPRIVPAALLQLPEQGGAIWWIAVLADFATIVIALALITAAPAMMYAAWNSRKLVWAIRDLILRLKQDIGPIVRQAREAADNLSYVATAIRSDVDGLRGTLHETQARLVRSADSAEQRMNDFNALLGVVQEEAERLFIDAASTVHGVRAGADALRGDDEWEELDSGSQGRR